MTQHVKVGGVWRAVDESSNCGQVNVGGTWRSVASSYVKVDGVWRSVCEPGTPTSTPTSTSTSTSTSTPGPGTPTPTAAPTPTILTMNESSTCTTITITWTGSNAQSWRITNSLGWTSTVEGEGGSGSHTFTVGTCGTTKTATLRLYSGSAQTGTTVSQAFTISTTGCASCSTSTSTAAPVFSATASGVGTTNATLNWSNPPVNTTFYYVWRAGVTGSTVTGTSYEFTGLSANTAYTLNVEAKNSNNQTIGSASAAITTTSSSGTPTADPGTSSSTSSSTADPNVWYCSGLNAVYGQYQYIDNYDADDSQCDYYVRVCQQGSYPAYPTSVPACSTPTSSSTSGGGGGGTSTSTSGPCTPNCQPTGEYVCQGDSAIYTYSDLNGCGSCAYEIDYYGCA